MERISASERTREELRALIDGRLGTAASRSDLVRLAVRLIVEEALDAEATEAVGRERYDRAAGAVCGIPERVSDREAQDRRGHGGLFRAAGARCSSRFPWRSARRWPGAPRRSRSLRSSSTPRGLSKRDIEYAFTDESGRRLLSRSAVSEVTERLWEEYEAFARRDLSEHRIVYLFVDGIAERLRVGRPREAVLAAWGIGEEGRKVLLHLMAGSKEDTETVRAFFQDMRAPGSAIRRLWSRTARPA